MSPVSLWASRQWGTISPIEDWEVVFRNPKNIVLTESQAEEDFIWAMQLLHGGEITIERLDPNKDLRQYRMSTMGSVFTTWDPSDRNRI